MKNWYRVALFNLIVLAFLGLVLRYKINFTLNFIEQKNLLHAHSHFAFNGWIGFLLQVLILDQFTNGYKESGKFWNTFFLLSTIVNYAMIISFAWAGYTGISIALSTVALWLSYVFAYKICKLLPASESNKISSHFLKAALFFLVLSSVGPYALAIIIAAKVSHPYWSHNALYFFLHFQYNGWFTFAVLAFLFRKLESSIGFNYRSAKIFFWLLAATCIPSLFFTSLWHHRPVTITVVIVVSALLQTVALFYLAKLFNNNIRKSFKPLASIIKWLYGLALSAFALKVLLQLFSIHPDIAQLAFGFRPIIIGYLHLIFLVFVSLFLLGILAEKSVIRPNAFSNAALTTFAVAVILNELLLGIQGLASIYYYYLPYINLILFLNTILLLIGAILIYKSSNNIISQKL